jgi:hypothetical protein
MNEITWVSLEEATESFEEMLDELYPVWEFGGVNYSPADILKSVDPTHYEIAFDEHLSYMAEQLGHFVKGATDPADYQ